MENFIQVLCQNCKISQVGYIAVDEKIDDEYKKCEECGVENKIVKFNDIVDEDMILEIVSLELENANHHSSTSLPKDIFESIKDFVEPIHHADVARKIANAIYNTI